MEDLGYSAGNPGEGPATAGLASSAEALASPLQAGRNKRAPLRTPGVGVPEGRGGAYVHTALGTSSPKVFYGTTEQGLALQRSRNRAKYLVRLSDSLLKLGFQRESIALWSCGNWFSKGVLPCGTVKLIPMHCDSPFCPECAHARARGFQSKVWDVIRRDKQNYFHLVLTKKSVRVLDRSLIDGLIQAFSSLRKKTSWSDLVEGGFYSVEITYNKKSGWHPHLHVLIKTKSRIPAEWLSQIKAIWFQVTGDSNYIRLERIYGTDKRGRKTRRINHRAINEIVKYTTKAFDFCEYPELVGQFLAAFKNVRRLQGFGCFFRVEKEAQAELHPEHDKNALAGCSCGKCLWASLKIEGRVHKSDTVLLPDGTRELSEEAKAKGPPESVLLSESMGEKAFLRGEEYHSAW